MDALAYFGLEPVGDGSTWLLPVTRSLCSPRDTLFGGSALGASIATLDHVTGRPVVWATAQFLGFAPAGGTVELEVVEVVRGRSTSQGRVLGRMGDREIFTVLAVYSDERMNWSILGWTAPSNWIGSIEPVWIIVLSPIFAVMWTRLGTRAPTTPPFPGSARVGATGALPAVRAGDDGRPQQAGDPH